MNKLTKAFKELSKLDYFAKRKLACCRSCASCLIPEGNESLFVYTTTQSDYQKPDRYNAIEQDIYLYWSAPEDNPNEILKVLRSFDFKVQKPKNGAFAIIIKNYKQ